MAIDFFFFFNMSKKNKKEKPLLYGGQALLEGVMMQGGGAYSMAVRTPDGMIVYKNGKRKSPKDQNKIWGLPILRGLASFVSSMVVGFSSLTWSAFWAGEEEEEQLTWKEVVFAIGLAVIFSILLFVVVPVLVGSFAVDYVGYFGRSLIEGLFRIGIFLAYLILVRKMPEIARTFQYHGAEHKTISTLEAGDPLTPESAQKFSTIHCRCGTSFILMSLILMVIVFTFVGNTTILGRIGIKIICMPVVLGIAYEVFRLPLRFPNSRLVKILIAPGLWMQKLTTNQPDNSQLEVAITALLTIPGFPNDGRYELPPNVISEEDYKALKEKEAAKAAGQEKAEKEKPEIMVIRFLEKDEKAQADLLAEKEAVDTKNAAGGL